MADGYSKREAMATKEGRKLVQLEQQYGQAAATAARKEISNSLRVVTAFKWEREPDIFRQLRSSFARLAPDGRRQAANSMIEMSRTLEQQGRLPKGSTDKLINDIEAKYPHLTEFLRAAGHASMNALNKEFQNQAVIKSVQDQIDNITNLWSDAPKIAKTTASDAYQNWATEMDFLKKKMHDSNGAIRQDAINAYNSLLQQQKPIVDAVKDHWVNAVESMHDKGSNNYLDMVYQAVNAMNAMGIDTNKALKALNVTPVDFKLGAVRAATSSIQKIVSGSLARGGVIQIGQAGQAGRDTIPMRFGEEHVMVAPGEVATVFNRHQMPEVQQRFADVGGLEGFFRQNGRPHHMASGGIAGRRRMAQGGYSGYALPMPKQVMGGNWSIDQGVDITAPGGTPLFAIGPGRIVIEGISGFGPNAPVLQVSQGPAAGHNIYYGHAGPDVVKVGQSVSAGQQISSVGQGIVGISSGPHLEIGFGPPFSHGDAMFAFLHQLMGGAGVTGVGGAGAAPAAPQIPHPHLASSVKTPLQTMGQHAIDAVYKAAQAYVDKHAPATGVGAAGLSGFVRTGAGTISVAQATGFINQALDILGIHNAGERGLWIQAVLRQIGRESSFQVNPTPPNDINTQRKDPSLGLMQTTGSTFKTYHVGGTSTNIVDPLANIAAAINYIIHRYGGGSSQAGASALWARGGGAYASGGVIPFLGGFQRGGVVSADKPSLMMIGEGGQKETAVVFPSERATAAPSSDPDIAIVDDQLKGLRTTLTTFTRSLKSKSKNLGDSISKTFGDMTASGGPLDQIKDAISNLANHVAVSLQRFQFSVSKSGRAIHRAVTDQQVAARNLALLSGVHVQLEREANILNRAMAVAKHSLQVAQKLTGEQRTKAVNAAKAAINNVRARQRDLNAELGQSAEDMVNAQETVQKAAVDLITRNADDANNAVDRYARVLVAFGKTPQIQQLAQQKIATANAQIEQLGQVLHSAEATGNATLAHDLRQQIQELQTTATEIAAQAFKDQVDYINNQAQASLDVNDAAAQIAQVGRVNYGVLDTLLRQRGTLLGGQLAQITALRDQAAGTGNDQEVQTLNAQIAQLNLAVAQNTQAIKDNTDAALQYRIDQVTAIADLSSGISDAVTGFWNSMTTLTGVQNRPAMLGALTTKGTGLATQQQGLKGALAQLLGYSPSETTGLMSMSGADLVQYVQSISSGPVFDAIWQRLGPTQQQQFTTLTESLLQNATSTVDNTNAIRALNGSMTGQTWSSTAWAWFRNAIFTGEGKLLPQYQPPSMDSGGIATKDGVYQLQRGEVAIPPSLQRGFGENDGPPPIRDLNVNIEQPVEQVDGDQIGRKAAHAWRTSR